MNSHNNTGTLNRFKSAVNRWLLPWVLLSVALVSGVAKAIYILTIFAFPTCACAAGVNNNNSNNNNNNNNNNIIVFFYFTKQKLRLSEKCVCFRICRLMNITYLSAQPTTCDHIKYILGPDGKPHGDPTLITYRDLQKVYIL